jgi:hypothetical protein
MEIMQEFSQSKWGKLFPSDIVLQKDEACINMGKKFLVHESEAGGKHI